MIKITIATLAILLGIGLALPDSVDASGCGLAEVQAVCSSQVVHLRPGQVRRAHRRAARAARINARAACSVAATCAAPAATTCSAPVAATTSAPVVAAPVRVVAPRICVRPRRVRAMVDVLIADPCCD